jgi:chromosomal replication initiation ATPase DnaA
MTSEVKSRSLADVLREKQIVADDRIEEALRYHAERGVPFDQALVDLNVLSEDDLRMIYSELFQVRFVKLEDVEIDREAVKHIPARIARHHHLMPVRRSGNALAVAMADPADGAALDALHHVTDFDIIPFIARYDAIEHAIYLHYGDSSSDNEIAASGESPTYSNPRNLIDDDRVGHVGRSLPLHCGWTFDAFVEDAANQFPLSVARAIADVQAEEGYNPYHCWGVEGCGKTHLLNAVAGAVMSRAPLSRVIYTDGERFVDNLFECIRDRKLNFFRYLYREADLLLIDDAHALLSRDWAQRELIETIRHMQRTHHFVVVAARDNIALEPRTVPELRIALESGVIAGFTTYSTSAKYEIVRRLAGTADLRPEIMKMLAEQCGNIKDLINLLQQVVVTSVIGQRDVNEAVVEELIQLSGIASVEGSARRARSLISHFAASAASRKKEPDKITNDPHNDLLQLGTDAR